MDYLKIFVDFADVLEPLGDAERGRLFTAMLLYAKDGTEPHFTGNERFVWPAAKQNIDRTAATAASRAQNGRVGGKQTQANASKAEQTQANASKAEQSQAIKDKDKDNIKDNDNKSTVTARFAPPTLEQVAEYIRDQGYRVDAQSFIDHYNSNGWRVGRAPMKNWQAAVRTWSRNEYGSAPAGSSSKPARVLNAQAYTQRTYTQAQIDAVKARRMRDILEDDA